MTHLSPVSVLPTEVARRTWEMADSLCREFKGRLTGDEHAICNRVRLAGPERIVPVDAATVTMIWGKTVEPRV